MHVKIVQSVKPQKKFDAIFTLDDGHIITVSFGAKRYEDYTEHHDIARRERYIKRHAARENWDDPMTAGSLSKHILWGEYTDINKNIRAFKKQFNLRR